MMVMMIGGRVVGVRVVGVGVRLVGVGVRVVGVGVVGV